MNNQNDIYENLPADPELAFLQLEEYYRADLDSQLPDANNNYQFQSITQDYLNKTVAAIRALGLENTQMGEAMDIPNKSYSGPVSDATERIKEMKMAIDAYRIQIRINRSFNRNKYSVVVNQAEKTKIRHYLENIRSVVDGWDINNKKKEAIFSRISALNLEIDRNRTRMEIFADLLLTTTGIANKAEKDLAPIRKWFNPLENLFGEAKVEADEQAPQITYSEPKQIEGPKKQLTGPQPKKTNSDAPFDEDIPF